MAASTSGKILVYDGDCPMCEWMSALFVRARLLPEARRRPFQAFTGELADHLVEAGIRNEMAVLDPAGGEIRSGIAGILWLLRDTPSPSARGLASLLDRRPLRDLATLAYRIVSYNRRILAPPRRAITCACEPDERPGYQLALIALLVSFAFVMTGLFGAVVAAGTGLASPRAGALQMVVAAGSGWVALVLAALGLPADIRLRFLGHLGMVMAGGLLVLVPSMLLSLAFSGLPLAAVFAASVLASFLLMQRMLARRLRYLGLSRAWLAGWVAALWAGATGSLWFFYFR